MTVRVSHREMAVMSSQPRVGPLLREWRKRRQRTQLDLALDAGISARHLSFVETGRWRYEIGESLVSLGLHQSEASSL
jgi:DNA-binding XRE family transcriptional regulator